MEKYSKGNITTIVLVGVLILVVGGYLLYQNQNQNKQVSSPQTTKEIGVSSNDLLEKIENPDFPRHQYLGF